MEDAGEYYSSPGMVSESFTLVRASGLEQVGPGGGTDNENIVPHRVALADLNRFLAGKRAQGVAIDVRILALIGETLLS